jgi:hypothetical protein
MHSWKIPSQNNLLDIFSLSYKPIFFYLRLPSLLLSSFPCQINRHFILMIILWLLLLYLRPYPAIHTLSNTGRSKKWTVSGNVLVLAVHNYRVANLRGTAVVLYMRKCYAHQTDAFQSLSHHYAANKQFTQFRVQNVKYAIIVHKHLQNIKNMKHFICLFLLKRKQK